jgi:hypothetical protein
MRSYHDWRTIQGLPQLKPVWDPVKGKLVLPDPLPQPYGHFKQGLHAQKVNEAIQSGGLDPIANPKLGSIAENFRGNLSPVAIDRHMVRAMGATDARGRPIDRLPPSGYGLAERLVQEEAAKMGLPPAQYQGAVRAGAAELTGLRSRDPILTTLANRIGITSGYYGTPEQEVLRRLTRYGFLLKSLGPLTVVAGTAASQQGDGTQDKIE